MMGGYGSGKRDSSKSWTCEAYRVDVRMLSRVGLIDPTNPNRIAEMPLRYTRNGQPGGSLLVRHDGQRPHEFVIEYRSRRSRDDAWQDVQETISLEWTPCHYGGQRVWCRCPGCGRRKAVLYMLRGRFYCVACNRLAYATTREDDLMRLGRRGYALLERLGAERTWVLQWWWPPDKPPRMHWRTYDRLIREWHRIRRQANDAYVAGLEALLSRPLPESVPLEAG